MSKGITIKTEKVGGFLTNSAYKAIAYKNYEKLADAYGESPAEAREKLMDKLAEREADRRD
jgi:pyruvate/oxaloacetate carboxyltransferase